MKTTAQINRIIREKTAFKSMDDMLNAGGNYRPSIDMADDELWLVAEAYDTAQEARGDDRRAYRYGNPTLAQVAKRMKMANAALRNETQKELGGYVTTREGVLVAVRDGVRISDAFVRVSDITGKFLREFIEEVTRKHYDRFDVELQIGTNAYYNFGDYLEGSDYTAFASCGVVEVPRRVVDDVWFQTMNSISEVA